MSISCHHHHHQTPQKDQIIQSSNVSMNILGEPDRLDLILNTTTPKSKLRQLAQKSVMKNKVKFNHQQQQQDQQDQSQASLEYLLDLGKPSQPIFDPALASTTSKHSFRRRSSGPASKVLTPSHKPRQSAVDESFELLFKNMSVSAASSSKADHHHHDGIQRSGLTLDFKRTRRTTIANTTSQADRISSDLIKINKNPLNTQTSRRRSRRITIVNISEDQSSPPEPESVSQLELHSSHISNEVYESHECDAHHDHHGSSLDQAVTLHELSISHNRRQVDQPARLLKSRYEASDSDDSIELDPKRKAQFELNRARVLGISSANPLETHDDKSPPRNKSTKKQPTVIDLTDSPPSPSPPTRSNLAEGLIERLNEEVFEKKLPGELDLIWSNRLNTDCREKVVIELGSKVVDSESRLMNTDEKHGKYFKAWARKIHKVIPQIEVTTKHTYEIDYKFKWNCSAPDCSKTVWSTFEIRFKPDKQMCECGGNLIAVPRIRKGKMKKVKEEEELNEMMENLVVKV
ncbi:hypothetical protein DFH28DRAFT_931722 [Melampsora americana]|nr:hypothetical protein DFH28DRAFT_931722 [Melampsora americana]